MRDVEIAAVQKAAKPMHHVVDAYEHVLLGRFPRARYLVGFDAQYLVTILRSLPEWLADWLLDMTTFNRPLPAALKKR